MSEFLSHDHAHADDRAWTDERLFDEVTTVVELLRIPRTETARTRLQRRLARATFEQMARYAEAHPEAVVLESTDA